MQFQKTGKFPCHKGIFASSAQDSMASSAEEKSSVRGACAMRCAAGHPLFSNINIFMGVTIAFAFFNGASASMAACRHTFPDGNTFDLSGLHRPRGQRDWYADDRNGNMYYFNICGDANDVPEACVMLNKAVRSPVFQVTNQSDCFWLGQVKSMEWELIDDSEPAAGVELYYFDGEQCSGGIARDVRIQLFCDPDAGVGKPLDYYVLEEDCHYSVTWPSKYGCPAASGGLFGSGSGSWLTWLVFLFGAYVALGCTYNIMYQGAQFGLEAMPNADMWRELPGLLGDGLSYTKAKIEEISNRNKPSYERVDGL